VELQQVAPSFGLVEVVWGDNDADDGLWGRGQLGERCFDEAVPIGCLDRSADAFEHQDGDAEVLGVGFEGGVAVGVGDVEPGPDEVVRILTAGVYVEDVGVPVDEALDDVSAGGPGAHRFVQVDSVSNGVVDSGDVQDFFQSGAERTGLGGLVDVVAEQFEDLFQERIEVGYDVLGDRGPKPQGVRAARERGAELGQVGVERGDYVRDVFQRHLVTYPLVAAGRADVLVGKGCVHRSGYFPLLSLRVLASDQRTELGNRR